MQKIIRDVDEKRGIVQVTVADERWYLKPSRDEETGLPVYKPVPSITWVAGYWPKGIGFYKWLANQGWDEAEAVKQAAGERGSAVHLAVEMILAGEEFRIDTEVQDKSRSTEDRLTTRSLTYEELICVQSFLEWKADVEKEYLIETLASEMVVISDKHNCGGTIDWVARLTNKETKESQVFLIDFKTGKSIWKEYELQLSAYAQLLQNGENPIEVNGKQVDLSGMKMAVLQLGYDRNKKGYKFTEIEPVFDLFLLAKQIWASENSKGTPGYTVRNFPLVLSKGIGASPVEQEALLPANDEEIEAVVELAPEKKPARKKKVKELTK